MYDYNTTRPPLILKEYGRNVQKLMEEIKIIDDKNRYTQKTYAIIKLLGILNTHAESLQKRWDDLFILSDYKSDIDSPYPIPIKEEKNKKCYVSMPLIKDIKYKYYGRNIELVLNKIATLPTLKEQEERLVEIVKLMHRFSNTWHNDYINKERVIENIKQMLSDGIVLDLSIIQTIPDDNFTSQKLKGNQQKTTISSRKKALIKRKLSAI